ncbi:hypothetical protein PCASD_19135 [Puccinia coronata f. sp. avenae]|uniref:Uncharacterized protein n=1 Tax=Puccinia coronata f. sp. avenae TaxID=200324 RepID=A0A2N5TSF3_9BASI|nr:hypothetical protein PCASD_19135 [Puccinia coronata f. sp. avenae]
MLPTHIEDDLTISQEIAQTGWPETQSPPNHSPQRQDSLPGQDALFAELETGSPLAPTNTSLRKHAWTNNIQDEVATLLNSEAREKQEQEQNISQLYSLQLQEAQSTINRLEEKLSRLRDGITAQVACLQDENVGLQKELLTAQKEHAQQLLSAQKDHGQLQKEATHLTVENSNLRSKLDLMQLCIELQQGSRGLMNYQPRPSGSGNYNHNSWGGNTDRHPCYQPHQPHNVQDINPGGRPRPTPGNERNLEESSEQAMPFSSFVSLE